MPDPNWMPHVPLVDERIGLMTCKHCGAVVMITGTNERPTPAQIHTKWHKEQNKEQAKTAQSIISIKKKGE